MKPSRFNLIIPTGKGDYLLYNSFTRATLAIDDELKNILESNTLDMIDERYLKPLKQNGIIVDTDDLETLKFKYLHEKTKFDTSHSDFIIFPTVNCNLQCTYCYESDYSDLKTTMDEERTNRVIEFIKWMTTINDSKWCVISLFGGEPLVAKNVSLKIVEEIAEWVKQNNKILYVSLTTNGILIDQELVESLFPYIDTVQVTLDGPKDVHDSLRIYRNGNGSFDQIINALKLLANTKTHISLRIHVDIRDGMEGLLTNVEKVLYELERLEIKNIPNLKIYFAQRAPPNACDQYIEQEFFLPAEKFGVQIFPKIWHLAKKLGWKVDEKQSSVSQTIMYCGYSKFSTYIISPTLELHICPVFTGYSEYAVGTINNKGRPEWNANYYDIVGRDLTEIGCNNCPYLTLCAGGCPIRAHMEEGTFRAKNCWTKKELSYERIKAHLRYQYPEKFLIED